MLKKFFHKKIKDTKHNCVGAIVKNDIIAPVVRVTCLNKKNNNSVGCEVIIVKAIGSEECSIDFVKIADENKLMQPVNVGSLSVPVGIKLIAGEYIDFPVGSDGKIYFVAHPWSGYVLVETSHSSRTFDLFSKSSGIVQISVSDVTPIILKPGAQFFERSRKAALEFSAELASRMTQLASRREALAGTPACDVLAIYTPRWKGVSAATRNLFPCALPFPLTPDVHPDDLDESTIAAVAEAITMSPFNTIVFSGGDKAFFRLFEECRERRPSMDFRLLWHSSYMQMGEPHDWRLLMPWLNAAQQKRLSRFGVVKPGMERFLALHGIEATFVQNAAPFQRSRIREKADSDVVGIWLSGSSDYRKPVVPSLLAVAGLPNLKLRAAGIGLAGREIVDELRIPAITASAGPIPHADVLRQMRQSALTLYVTLSECMPMVPLESISEGVPCIVGPGTELFTDDPALAEWLVVKDPNDPAAIRQVMTGVLDRHDDVSRQCLDYLEALNARSAKDLASFLE